MRYHPTPMTNAFQFPPKSPRTDPHKHSLALIVDVTKISNIFFRDPKNIFWGRTIAHPGCRGSFWHLLSHPRPLVADSSALFSRWRVRKSAIKALVLTVPASKPRLKVAQSLITTFKNRNHARNASLDNPSLHHTPTHDGTHATHKALGLGPNGASLMPSWWWGGSLGFLAIARSLAADGHFWPKVAV